MYLCYFLFHNRHILMESRFPVVVTTFPTVIFSHFLFSVNLCICVLFLPQIKSHIFPSTFLSFKLKGMLPKLVCNYIWCCSYQLRIILIFRMFSYIKMYGRKKKIFRCFRLLPGLKKTLDSLSKKWRLGYFFN